MRKLLTLFPATLLILTALRGSILFASPPATDPQSVIDATLTRDVVTIAGGAVAFRLPAGWFATEVPHRREVRVLLTSDKPRRRKSRLVDGIWLTYHVVPRQQTAEVITELNAMAVKRLGTISKTAPSVLHNFTANIDNWPSVITELGDANAKLDDAQRHLTSNGQHVLIRTNWGFVEFYAIAPSELISQRQASWKFVLDSLRLSPLPPLPVAKTPDVVSASPILGSWKSYRARLHLNGQGEIAINFDRPRIASIEINGSNESSRKIVRLSGRFRARDDLILITWDDGSKLNYRWRLHNGELLLTDHTGQVSQLRRLVD